jgi:hypothetical protein
MRIRSKTESGMALVELMTAALLIVTFFAGIFEINAVCLRYIAAGKESIAAIAAANDRAEALRNLSFLDLTNSNTVASLVRTPANAAAYTNRVGTTEVVKISAFPTPNGTSQFTRVVNSDNTVTVTTNSVATNLGSTLVKVDVITSWKAVFGQRARTEQVTTIISNGTKK